MSRFQDKVAIVTGAGRGLGAQFARDLAREGAVVALWGIHAANVTQVQREIESEGGRALAFAVDVSDDAGVEAAVAEIVSRFERVDILINNAAYHSSHPVAETPVWDWKKQIDTNLSGTFFCVRAVLPHMLRQKYGKILNIASAAAKVYFPGFAAYAAAKAGVVNFTSILNEEVKYQNINVNSILLGMTNTERTRERIGNDPAVTIQLDEMLQPEEVSRVALFLVSDDARPIKGAAIDVFGNRY